MNTKNTIAAIPLALITSLALPATASAASSDWAGPYIGAHLGSGQENSVNFDVAGGGTSESFDMTGILGGVQGGINWAAGGMVVGFEVSASAADVSGDGNCPNPAYQCGAKLDQLYTIQGKVGIPLNNVLLYASAGGASSHIEATVTGPERFSNSDNQTGWVAGLGGAMALANNWNGVIELQYLDFGSNDYSLGGTAVSMESNFVTLKVGVNYMF
ncbi:MAG TPA: outer membrane beta-barrel protein [Gammaproteobacteria bacterium]